MRTERIHLHIGAEKTGTTTIQRTLEKARPELAAHGVLFPKTPGAFNHIALTAYGLDDERGIEEMRVIAGIAEPAGLPDFRARLRDDLAAEIEASGAHTVILSNEHMSSRLLRRREVVRLRKLLASLAREIRVVMYIREPVSYFESWYSTAVASGATWSFPDPLPPSLLRTADWAAITQRWASVFGDEALILRRMEDGHYAGGDLVADFFAAAGLEGFSPPRIERRNESLSRRSLLFLRGMNAHLPRMSDGRMNEARAGLIPALRRWQGPDRFRIGDAQAAEIAAHYEPSYQWLQARYFPDSPGPLFRPREGSGASGDPGGDELTPSDIYALAAHLWKNRTDVAQPRRKP
ncbi:hypothetical protein GI374_13285 [Paracoccus sp. S-4012]|uniref:hypothetical protein n=1 Tax=Paracoccus sp. S-4012 TaxID=2665648 RepID=UPI0012B05098|nr:hypothetical protein [Paracoccus sp. S-4012]MRX51397.1 hypothetical protein [Paracoccus sp. S-4012]